MKDTGDFLNKIKNKNAIPENVILLTADVVDLVQVYHIELVWRHLGRHWIKGKHIKYLRVN